MITERRRASPSTLLRDAVKKKKKKMVLLKLRGAYHVTLYCSTDATIGRKLVIFTLLNNLKLPNAGDIITPSSLAYFLR